MVIRLFKVLQFDALAEFRRNSGEILEERAKQQETHRKSHDSLIIIIIIDMNIITTIVYIHT